MANCTAGQSCTKRRWRSAGCLADQGSSPCQALACFCTQAQAEGEHSARNETEMPTEGSRVRRAQPNPRASQGFGNQERQGGGVSSYVVVGDEGIGIILRGQRKNHLTLDYQAAPPTSVNIPRGRLFRECAPALCSTCSSPPWLGTLPAPLPLPMSFPGAASRRPTHPL